MIRKMASPWLACLTNVTEWKVEMVRFALMGFAQAWVQHEAQERGLKNHLLLFTLTASW